MKDSNVEQLVVLRLRWFAIVSIQMKAAIHDKPFLSQCSCMLCRFYLIEL